jgi:hypothetical protein
MGKFKLSGWFRAAPLPAKRRGRKGRPKDGISPQSPHAFKEKTGDCSACLLLAGEAEYKWNKTVDIMNHIGYVRVYVKYSPL